MKKYFLALVFVFSTSTLMNANSSVEVQGNSVLPPSCFDQADAIATAFGLLLNMDYESEHNLFLTVYDACKASGQE